MRARARDASVEPQWAQPIINWRGSVRAGAPFEMNSHRLTPDMGHPPGDRFGPAPVLSSKDSTSRRDSLDHVVPRDYDPANVGSGLGLPNHHSGYHRRITPAPPPAADQIGGSLANCAVCQERP